MIDCLRREAVLVTIAHPNGEVALDLGVTLNKKGITLRGIFGRRLWSSWEQLLLMLDAGTLDLSTMVTHRLPLAQIEEAKKVCARCEVRAECLAWALEAGQDHGVWGGMSEDERRAIKRRQSRSRVRRS